MKTEALRPVPAKPSPLVPSPFTLVRYHVGRDVLDQVNFQCGSWKNRKGISSLTLGRRGKLGIRQAEAARLLAVTAGRVRHRGKGFSWRASCGIILTLDSGEVLPGLMLATPWDGAAMIGNSNDSGRHGDHDDAAAENLVAEGIATAVAVALLATVAFVLFRG